MVSTLYYVFYSFPTSICFYNKFSYDLHGLLVHGIPYLPRYPVLLHTPTLLPCSTTPFPPGYSPVVSFLRFRFNSVVNSLRNGSFDTRGWKVRSHSHHCRYEQGSNIFHRDNDCRRLVMTERTQYFYRSSCVVRRDYLETKVSK